LFDGCFLAVNKTDEYGQNNLKGLIGRFSRNSDPTIHQNHGRIIYYRPSHYSKKEPNLKIRHPSGSLFITTAKSSHRLPGWIS